MVTEIWSTLAGKLKSESAGHTESNGGGGDLPSAAMASDRAPKAVSLSTADQRQNDVPGGSGWSEMEEGVAGNKNPTGGVTQNSCEFPSFDCRRSGCFSAVRMAGERRPTSKLQIGTKLGRNSG